MWGLLVTTCYLAHPCYLSQPLPPTNKGSPIIWIDPLFHYVTEQQHITATDNSSNSWLPVECSWTSTLQHPDGSELLRDLLVSNVRYPPSSCCLTYRQDIQLSVSLSQVRGHWILTANINLLFSVTVAGFDLNDSDLSIAKDVWLPLVVSAGPMLTDSYTSGISKIAESVIIPLADQSISVYCLSTYRMDYVLVSMASSSEKIIHSFSTIYEDAVESFFICLGWILYRFLSFNMLQAHQIWWHLIGESSASAMQQPT